MQTPKRQVFLIHLAISAAIAAALIATMYLLWFPGELFSIAGGWQGLQLILAVDLVLGPSLTLLIYRAGKKSAVFDLSMIALVQALALGWGVSQAYAQRVEALVFAEGRFVTVPAASLKLANQELRAAGHEVRELDELDDQRPAQIAAEAFVGEALGQYFADTMNGLPGLQERADRYLSLAAGYGQLDGFELSEATLHSDFPDIAARLRLQPCEHCALYRIKARYGRGVAVLDRRSKRIVEMLAQR